MAENKTKPTEVQVSDFLDAVHHPQKRADAYRILEIMKEVTGAEPRMWGDSMVGFGEYHYKYESGREGDFFVTGFAPRKSNISLYIMAGFSKYQDYLDRLGKHKTGKSCLYINKLADVDEGVLRELVAASVQHMQGKYPVSFNQKK